MMDDGVTRERVVGGEAYCTGMLLLLLSLGGSGIRRRGCG
jgi:hypothetical protein